MTKGDGLNGTNESSSNFPPGVVHILSDLATPHNNALVQALRRDGRLRVITWYAFRQISALPWKKELGGDVDNYYFDTWLARWNLITTLLRRPRDHILLVGYSNALNRLVLLWCVLTGRRFMMWFDQPSEKQGVGALARRAIYAVIKKYANPLFVVGKHAMQWFESRGFRPERLVNLPIFIEIPDQDELVQYSGSGVRDKYGVAPDEIFVVGASRLVHSKGYDLLVQALAKLDLRVRSKLKVVIAGTGPESSKLHTLIRHAGLHDHIHLEEWLSPEDYKKLVASADIFVHPARFDAFGGGTLFAMACGVPIIGSNRAGSVMERIDHEKNGLIYPPEDVDELVKHLHRLGSDPSERAKFGRAARQTAEQWPPEHGARILICSIINRPT